MLTIWFESHGTTRDNETKHASGWNDIDLSDMGLKQAQELVGRNHGRRLNAIFCSDLQRAVKSAVPTANKLLLPMFVDERLRECNYGDMNGQPSGLVEAEKAQRIYEPFPNGESYDQCLERMQNFLNDLKRNFDDQTVLIIGHRATQYGLEVIYLGKTLEQCLAEQTDYWKWQPGWKYQLK